jgi:hypothetical protein
LERARHGNQPEISPATVLLIWKKHKLQPHRSNFFKVSNDPDFASKPVRHHRCLYVKPPEKRHCPKRGRKESDLAARSNAAGAAAA